MHQIARIMRINSAKMIDPRMNVAPILSKMSEDPSLSSPIFSSGPEANPSSYKSFEAPIACAIY